MNVNEFCIDVYATTLLQFSLKKQKTEVRFIEFPQFNYVGKTMHEDKEREKGHPTLAWQNEGTLIFCLFSGIAKNLMLNNFKKRLFSCLLFFRYNTKCDHCRAI